MHFIIKTSEHSTVILSMFKMVFFARMILFVVTVYDVILLPFGILYEL